MNSASLKYREIGYSALGTAQILFSFLVYFMGSFLVICNFPIGIMFDSTLFMIYWKYTDFFKAKKLQKIITLQHK